MEDIKALLNLKKINQYQYRAYLRFGSDEGKRFLADMIHTYCMEQPVSFSGETGFAWQAGRLSIWRDMQNAVDDVDEQLRHGEANDE
jgi:hypothetical protein